MMAVRESTGTGLNASLDPWGLQTDQSALVRIRLPDKHVKIQARKRLSDESRFEECFVHSSAGIDVLLTIAGANEMHALGGEELQRMMKDPEQDFVLINVLSPQEFNQQHIRNSVNVPLKLQSFAEVVAEIAGNRERKVVVYCDNFDCDASTRAATELEAEGFINVYDYEGGMKDWSENQRAA
jgi:rhodanese-related sulfurtransferase